MNSSRLQGLRIPWRDSLFSGLPAYGRLLREKTSLRTALTVPFILIFGLTVMLQTLQQHLSLAHLIENESGQVLRQMSDSVVARLDRYLDAPVAAQRAVANALQAEGLAPRHSISDTAARLSRLFEQLYLNDTQIKAIGFGTEAGEYAGLRRGRQDGLLNPMLRDTSRDDRLLIFEGARPDDSPLMAQPYDPRIQPWYKPALVSPGPVWTSLYVNQDERQELAMSFTGVVASAGGHGPRAGVVAVDLTLNGINAHLRAEHAMVGGTLVITDEAGLLVAHSESGSVLMSERGPRESDPRRLALSESPNPLVRQAARQWARLPARDHVEFQLEFGGEMHYARVARYVGAGGLDWRIMTILPEHALLENAAQARTAGLLIALGMGGMGLLCGVWVVGLVTRPILRAADAASQLSLGEPNKLQSDGLEVRETAILMRAFSDMAARLQASFHRLRELVQIDEVTGLATRRCLIEYVSWEQLRPCSLVLLGLDGFRNMNDIVGYATGDRVLHAVATRLTLFQPAPDLLARIGGDEFVMLYVHKESGDNAGTVELARRALRCLDAPLVIDADALSVRASAGALQGLLSRDNLGEILRRAGAALSHAKSQRTGSVVPFSDELLKSTLDRGLLMSGLRTAVEREEFVNFYQPIVDIASGQVVGVETLARWRHPVRGLLAPGAFLECLESSDLVVKFGEQVLRQAFRDLAVLRQTQGAWLDLHVNVSARQLLQSNLPEVVLGMLREFKLPAEALTLELTESMFIDAGDTTITHVVMGLRAINVRLAIDDFGTGYSSLSYLERLPIDALKIDRAFVCKLFEPDGRAAALTETIITVGRQLDLEMVAEGIETPQQAQRLLAMGCRRAQGYLFGRPVAFEQLDLSRRTHA